MTRPKPSAGSEGVEIGRRALHKLLLLAALVAGTMVLVLPATASADARVQTQVPCVAYANAGTTFYSGSGTEVITQVMALTPDGRGGLIIADSARGLLWWQRGRLRPFLNRPSGEAGQTVVLHTDRSDRVWIAFGYISST